MSSYGCTMLLQRSPETGTTLFSSSYIEKFTNLLLVIRIFKLPLLPMLIGAKPSYFADVSKSITQSAATFNQVRILKGGNASSPKENTKLSFFTCLYSKCSKRFPSPIKKMFLFSNAPHLVTWYKISCAISKGDVHLGNLQGKNDQFLIARWGPIWSKFISDNGSPTRLDWWPNDNSISHFKVFGETFQNQCSSSFPLAPSRLETDFWNKFWKDSPALRFIFQKRMTEPILWDRNTSFCNLSSMRYLMMTSMEIGFSWSATMRA